MIKSLYPLLILLCLSVTSCKTADKPSDLNYMQNVDQTAQAVALASDPLKLQDGDVVNIFVSAKNMDVVKPFNQNYYSSQSASNPASSATSSGNTEKSYLLGSDGTIDFPILGKITARGKNLEQLRDELTTRISAYVKNPVVSVRLTNFRVTVLGEVARPGQYTIDHINPTVLNALGLAGDLTMFGKRDNILVVRNENGHTTQDRINLMDATFINSPFFQLKQGDVIYVSANQTKEKTARQDPNTNIYIAVAGTLIGLAGIFITIFKK